MAYRKMASTSRSHDLASSQKSGAEPSSSSTSSSETTDSAVSLIDRLRPPKVSYNYSIIGIIAEHNVKENGELWNNIIRVFEHNVHVPTSSLNGDSD